MGLFSLSEIDFTYSEDEMSVIEELFEDHMWEDRVQYWNGQTPGIANLTRIHGMSPDVAMRLKTKLQRVSTPKRAMEVVAHQLNRPMSRIPSQSLFYIDMGDPYITTMMYDSATGSIRVGTWGHWYERRTIYRKNWNP